MRNLSNSYGICFDVRKLFVAMAKKGYSNKDLANKTGLGLGTISNARGGKPIRTKTAYKIAKALDLNFSELNN